MKNKILVTLACWILFLPLLTTAYAPQKRLLIFLPYENYSATQFNTLSQTSINQGYTVDVVSATTGTATAESSTETYTVPNTSSTTKTKITLGQTTIQDLTRSFFATNYDALILIGGSGSQTYFFDGFYTSTTGVTLEKVATAASTINQLVNEALHKQKIVAGVEYGAALLAYTRLEGTSPGPDNLGMSVLAGKNATTWDYNQTLVNAFSFLGINLLDGAQGPAQGATTGDAEPVVIDGPTNYPDTLLTGRDNSDATLTYIATTLFTMLATYPDPDQKNYLRRVVVFGGDQPQLHGIPYESVAKHTDIANYLNTLDLNISSIATADQTWFNTALGVTDKTSSNYFDAAIYFRMYATANQTTLNQTLKTYVEQGGLLIIIHHGLYNDSNQKGTLATLSGLIGLAGGEIPATTSSNQMIYPGPHYLLNTNLGHFIPTYKVIGNERKTYTDTHTPSTISNQNTSSATYFSFSINPDELITNITVNPTAQVTPLFANNYTDETGSNRFMAWTRNVGQGKVFFYEPGERNDSSLINENLQVLENALLWGSQPAANRYTPEPTTTATTSTTPNQTITFTPVGTPLYEAKWISQTQGTGSGTNQPHLLSPGQSIEIEAVFQNTGNRAWYRDVTRSDFVGFYVYKDPLYSTPLEFNDPQNPLYGTSYFFDSSWGPSYDGLTEHCRAALLQEEVVYPGEQAHFIFNFKAPDSALSNAATDNPQTVHNEYYYREDLTLAYGAMWMSNRTNGDPWHRAHVWFPIRIE